MINNLNKNDVVIAVSVTIATIAMVIIATAVYVSSGWML